MLRLIVGLYALPLAALAQVEQGAPNANFAPAFENQTRAPELAKTQLAQCVFDHTIFAWRESRKIGKTVLMSN